ncbi:MAG: hypothetical protein ACI8WB_003110, partial [Phenylobacterium sp.]
MSLTQDLVAAAQAANHLTQQVSDKITSIDQRVTQFQTDATNVVATTTAQLRRAKIGSSQGPQVSITPGPDDDTGLLVQQAFSDGAKHVHVDWGTDGL